MRWVYHFCSTSTEVNRKGPSWLTVLQVLVLGTGGSLKLTLDEEETPHVEEGTEKSVISPPYDPNTTPRPVVSVPVCSRAKSGPEPRTLPSTE